MLRAKQNRVVSQYYEWANAFGSLTPELIADTPDGNSVLIIAPHCDDEALGCGGTIYKHSQRGCRTTAIFMTDGSASDSKLTVQELVKIRKKEAEQSAKILGIDRCVFLDYPDRRLKKSEDSVQRLVGILEETHPDLIYIPFHLENHPDHMATSAIALTALKRKPVKEIFLYEVWTAMIPNRLVDISNSIEKKLEAVRVYRSQKDIDEFAEKARGLNRFRSLQSDNQFQYAEAFFKLELKSFPKLSI